MLHSDLKLDDRILTDEFDQQPTRVGFGAGLLEAGKRDERVVGLCCDLTGSTKMNLFAEQFPNRFVEMGVAEQNLASVASGMAAMGKVPFISSYAMFSPGRNWEQIRTTICYNDVNVKMVGSHAGVSVGPDGGTHQAIEDIAITRVIPRMSVVYPCDHIQAQKATEAIAQTTDPTYLRLAREKSPVVTTEDTPFELGKAQLMYVPESPDIRAGIIATGPLVAWALRVAKHFDDQGIGIKVLNIHTIKPLDTEAVLEMAKTCGRLMTVEEHQRAGGMGSAVVEYLSENYPILVERVGIDDEFGESGEPEELLAKHRLDEEGIRGRMEAFLK